MKKLLTLAALAVFALVLTGCPKDVPAGGSDPNNGDITSAYDLTVDLSVAKHVLADWAVGWGEGTNNTKYANGKLTIACGNGWANSTEIALDADLSEYKTITVKGAAKGWEADGALKIALYSADGGATEFTKDWGEGFFEFDATTKETSMNLADGGTLYGAEAAADLSSITKVVINPQGGTGTLEIEAIGFNK